MKQQHILHDGLFWVIYKWFYRVTKMTLSKYIKRCCISTVQVQFNIIKRRW